MRGNRAFHCLASGKSFKAFDADRNNRMKYRAMALIDFNDANRRAKLDFCLLTSIQIICPSRLDYENDTAIIYTSDRQSVILGERKKNMIEY